MRQTFRNTTPDSFAALPTQMPPLGTYQEDTLATRILSAWIHSLPASGLSGNIRAVSAKALPFVRNGILWLPDLPAAGREHANGGMPTVSLSDAQGRNIRLQPSGAGRFRIDASYSPGLHYATYLGRSFPVVLF